ncbi:iron-sulfur cluster assembly scaffold protein [Crateriforma conspicua]|uniref:NifU-like protein n=1 Tax=Crateriforma conspicua TaxID=2527996 RepID=A0A5C5Y393_9PLAN|nr:iron-sulfur cluster assembly scaffold protein [Crateriforma conspicua]TWT69690.1 NifU-like protein [Crateriforma conspicua]
MCQPAADPPDSPVQQGDSLSHDDPVAQVGGDDRVRDHYEDPFGLGGVDQPTHAAEIANPFCGDYVRIELRLEDGEIDEVGFHADGGVVCQAAASMLCQHVDGQTIDVVRRMTASDMVDLYGESLTPGQQKCALLPWRCLDRAIDRPLDDESDDSVVQFGGPSLGEES